MKKLIGVLCALAVFLTASSFVNFSLASPEDIDLLTNFESNYPQYATVTKTAGGIRTTVTKGVDAQNIAFGLALTPELTGLDLSTESGTGFIHLVMESDTPFRVTMYDRTVNVWISLGGEFFNVFVPEGFTFANPDAPTIQEAFEDGKEFMRAGTYDVYLNIGAVYEWKANNGEADKYDPKNASITGLYFEAMNPGTFTIQEMTLTLDPKAPVLDENGFAYCVRSDNTVEIVEYTGSATNVTVPSTLGGYPVKSIRAKAFYNCTLLERITFPAGIMTIGDKAFYNCISLESVTLPIGATAIGDEAFTNCWSLEDVYYAGSQTQWASITFGSDASWLRNGTIHFNYDGNEETPSEPLLGDMNGDNKIDMRDAFALYKIASGG